MAQDKGECEDELVVAVELEQKARSAWFWVLHGRAKQLERKCRDKMGAAVTDLNIFYGCLVANCTVDGEPGCGKGIGSDMDGAALSRIGNDERGNSY